MQDRKTHREKYILRGYRENDKKKNLECTLTEEWIVNNILNKTCTYCGTNIKLGCDRIDNSKGHTKDNCIPCCYSCNIMRGDRFSYNEMMILSPVLKEIMGRRNDNQ